MQVYVACITFSWAGGKERHCYIHGRTAHQRDRHPQSYGGICPRNYRAIVKRLFKVSADRRCNRHPGCLVFHG